MALENSATDTLKVDGNLLTRVDQLERRLAQLERRDVSVNTLGEITDNLGDMRAGRFLALSNGSEPTEPDAAGVFMSAEGETFGTVTAHLGGVGNGNLQFGVNADTGEALYAGGISRLNMDGMVFNQNAPRALEMDAEDASGKIYRMSLGMADMVSGGKPVFQMTYWGDCNAGNYFTNGDFEAGDFTDWGTSTFKSSGTAEWSISTDKIRGGQFSANIYMEGGYDLYGTLQSGTFDVTGFTPGDSMVFSGAVAGNNNFIPRLIFYNGTGGGLGTAGWTNNQYNSGAGREWWRFVVGTTIPTNSVSCRVEVVFAHPGAFFGAGYTTNGWLDDLQLQLMGAFSQTQWTPDGMGGGMGQHAHQMIFNGCNRGTHTLSYTASANQPLGGWWGFASPANGDEFSLPAFPLEAGSYTVRILGAKHPNHAKLDWYWDNTLVASGQDWYASSSTPNVEQSFTITTLGGTHVLLGRVNGRNASAGNWFFGLSEIMIN